MTWVDVTGTADGFGTGDFDAILVRAPARASIDWGILRQPASLAVVAPAPSAPAVDYCRIQFPPDLTVTAGVDSGLVFGRVFETVVTEGPGQGAGLLGELGFGPLGSDPAAGGWVYSAGVYNGDLMNDFGTSLSDDEYRGSMLVPVAGSYSYAWRFSLDAGASWTWCDKGGSGNGYDPADAGLLTAQ